jgi:hypothetical protein
VGSGKDRRVQPAQLVGRVRSRHRIDRTQRCNGRE